MYNHFVENGTSKEGSTMFGFSVFMNADLTTTDIDAIEEMALQGFSGIFTSMHIPEDDVSAYQKRLIELGSEKE